MFERIRRLKRRFSRWLNRDTDSRYLEALLIRKIRKEEKRCRKLGSKCRTISIEKKDSLVPRTLIEIEIETKENKYKVTGLNPVGLKSRFDKISYYRMNGNGRYHLWSKTYNYF